MVIQYLLFFISVGLLLAILLNLVNILTFRLNGKVIGYQFKVGSAEYNKYRSHAGTKALLLTLLGVAILSFLIFLQAWEVERKRVSGSTTALVFGSALALAFVLWVFYSIAKMSENMHRANRPSTSHKKNGKDDSWLV